MSAAQPRDKGRAANLALVLLISSGVMFTLVAFTFVWKLQERTQAVEFERNAADIHSSLQRNIHASLHELESIAAFYAASREIERHEFRVFVNPFLSRNSSIQALEWVPRVPGPQRAAFEQAAKRDGFPGFQITEINHQGQLVRAAPRAEYFPVYFMEPNKGNEPALGFDLASEPKRLQALHMMRDTGKAVSSGPIRLVQETGRQKGFLIFWPIYRRGAPQDSVASRRANLEGLLTGVFRTGDLVESALKELEPRGLDVYLLDESAPQGQRLLYVKSSRPGQASLVSNAEQDVAILRKDLHHAATLEVAGWKSLVLTKPRPDSIGTRGTWQPWAVLLGGLVFTGFLAVHINNRKRAEEAVRRLNEELDLRVVERTAQLEATGNSLRDEITERTRVESLLHAIGHAHSKFITRITPDVLFGDLLSDLLSLTHSEYGFIGEILHADNGEPYLKTHAITNIAWNEETREMYSRFAPNLEFFNLKTLFGAVITTGEPVIANDPSTDPRRGGPPPGHPPMQVFLGLPLRGANELVGMVGIANRPGGYDEGLVEYLQPLLNSCGNLIAAQRSDQRRKLAEAALRESEERYRDLVEHSQVMMCTHDLQGRVLSLNRAAEQCLGYDRSVILETNLREWLAPEVRHRFEEYLEAVQRDGVDSGVMVVLNSAGERRVWEYHNTLRTEGTAAPIVRGVAHDVTERKQAEEQLHEMSMALTNAMPGISRLDPEGRYVFVNDAYARMLAYEPAELVGKDWTPTVHPEDRGVARDAYLRMLREGKGEFEARAVCKDGSEFFKVVLMVKRVDSGGNLLGHHCFMKDITERKQAENIRGALYQASLEVQVPLTLDERLTHLLQTAKTILELDRVNIVLADAEGRMLTTVASFGTEEPLEAISVPIGPEGGGLAQAFLTQQIVSWDGQGPVPDPLRLRPPYDQIEAFRSQVFVNVPLVVQGQAIGVLGADRKQSRRPLDSTTLNLLQLFAAQAAVAIHNARLFEQVQAGRERLQSLSRRLVEVQEAERRHIARELHDEIGQALTALRLALEMGTRVTTAAAARTGIGEAKAMVQELISRVRDLSLDLRPAMLDDLGLLPAVLWHIERYTAQTRVKVAFEHTGLDTRFSPEAETAAYRIVQEALTNVARHAGVSEVTVRLLAHQESLSVHVEDQGAGFDPGEAFASAGTSGIAGMRERATLLGGRLVVESAPGAGARVTAELPLSDTLERRADARYYPAGG